MIMEKRTNQELMALRQEHVPPGPYDRHGVGERSSKQGAGWR